MRPATLAGWRVTALRDRVYPGLVPAGPDSAAAGQLLADLTVAEWLVIDAFEDDSYTLDDVTLTDGSATSTYAWSDTLSVEPQQWDAGRFESDQLPPYVERSAAWRDRYAATLPNPAV